MPLTSSDIRRLERLYAQLKAQSGASTSRAEPTLRQLLQSTVTGQWQTVTGERPTLQPPKTDKEDKGDSESFIVMNIQMRRFAMELTQFARQLGELQVLSKENAEAIQKMTETVGSAVNQISSLQFNTRLFMQGGVGRGTAVLGSVTEGMARGMDAANMTKAIGEKVEAGEIRFGTEEDRRAFAVQETQRIWLSLFGIRI